MRKLITFLVTCVLMLTHVPAYIQARSVYQEPAEFIEEVFTGVTPQKKRLWIKKDLKQKINDILGHDLSLLRIRYWHDQQRTAWILEEIGKSEPITMGFVVNGGAIEITRVLVFRESRGWEIRHPFFTDQYKDVTLKEDLELNRPIDGISGATMSVSAVNKLARLALMLHQHSDATTGQ